MQIPGRKIILLCLLCLTLGQANVYGMAKAKEWVNKIKPGTFEEESSAQVTEENRPRSFSESELKILIALKKREEELKKREALHQKKANELKNLSQQIEQKLDQMRGLAARVETERKTRKEMDERDISKMVRYYETMAPENTAVFFNRMDRQTATHLLLRMNPRKASAVMQLLNPEVAVEITERVTRFKSNRDETKE
ncbi:MAG: hypothetical protein COB67_03520 [SAR324 cluster bacterium]|uniref:Magnesium transporter MgtE intracellular domain-containing protein n=1 Tax=SAR324 cluster bacterium TaxID=2024889 RepID=A0A2A4T7T3_9DELT|nr:MAG: hypothetical protein COB67_03520 [SAR324 cluster bacterium]